MRKILRIFIPILLVFVLFTSILPITVQAEEVSTKVDLHIKGNIDPRIKAKGDAIFISFFNMDVGEMYEFYLYDYNNYQTTVEVEEGEIITFSAVVTGDLEFKYPVEPVEFYAEGWSMDIVIVAGDPNYKGEIEENNQHFDFPGGIDQEKTNELLKEDGLPEVDWEYQFDKRYPDTDGDGVKDVYDDDDDGDGIPDEDDNDKDGDGVPNEDEYKYPSETNPTDPEKPDDDKDDDKDKIKDSDGDGIPDDEDDDDDNDEIPDDEDDDKDGNGIKDDEEKVDDDNNSGENPPNTEKPKEEDDKKGFAIMFVIILALVCGVVIFFKFKNSLDEE